MTWFLSVYLYCCEKNVNYFFPFLLYECITNDCRHLPTDGQYPRLRNVEWLWTPPACLSIRKKSTWGTHNWISKIDANSLMNSFVRHHKWTHANGRLWMNTCENKRVRVHLPPYSIWDCLFVFCQSIPYNCMDRLLSLSFEMLVG